MIDWGEYASAVHRWEQVIGRPAPYPVDEHRCLLGSLPEWLMGLSEGWLTGVEGLSRSDHLRLAGGGVNPLQGELALCLLLGLPHTRGLPESSGRGNSWP